MTNIYNTVSSGETQKLGFYLGKILKPGDIVCLNGELGAGKTCMIQGIAKGLHVPDNVYITSPTFVILNEYQGKLPIYHFDFYRISSAEEAIDIGCEEYFWGQGVCLIEWPEQILTLLPDQYLKIDIMWQSKKERRIELQGIGFKYKTRLLRNWGKINSTR